MRATVVIAEPDQLTAATARAAFIAGGLTVVHAVVRERSVLLATTSELHPDVVVLDASAVPTEIGDAVREILTLAPETVVIVTAAVASAAALSRAVVAGARGFLLKPYVPEELVATALDALANARSLRETKRGPVEARTDRGTLITVYSPKGGVGTTTIAAHLAVTLATRTKARVGIVDLDLQFGDVGVLFDLKSSNSVLDLIDRDVAVDDAVVNETFVKHASGVRALLAPESLSAAMTVDPAQVGVLVGRLRDHFDYLICDTWSALDELSTVALTAADRVVLVTTPELHSLRSLQRVLNEHAALRTEPRNPLVLNRYPSRVGLDLREVERGLGRGVSVAVPSRGVEMTRAVNEGIATSRAGTDPTVAHAMGRLADLVSGRETRTAEASASLRTPSTV